MLHIVNSFPISPSFLEHTKSGDTVIFTENAVLAVKQENYNSDSLQKNSFCHINLCVRNADLQNQNISNQELLRGVAIIDDMQYKIAISQNCVIKSCN